MLINRDELKAQMVRKHYSREKVANLLNITIRSFHDKLAGTRDFKETEIVKLVSVFSSAIFTDYCVSVLSQKKKGG